MPKPNEPKAVRPEYTQNSKSNPSDSPDLPPLSPTQFDLRQTGHIPPETIKEAA